MVTKIDHGHTHTHTKEKQHYFKIFFEKEIFQFQRILES